MKAFFLTGSIVLTVLILIIGFENLGATVQNFMILFTPVASPFLIVMGLSAVGILTGVFYTGLITSIIRGNKEEDESPGSEW